MGLESILTFSKTPFFKNSFLPSLSLFAAINFSACAPQEFEIGYATSGGSDSTQSIDEETDLETNLETDLGSKHKQKTTVVEVDSQGLACFDQNYSDCVIVTDENDDPIPNALVTRFSSKKGEVLFVQHQNYSCSSLTFTEKNNITPYQYLEPLGQNCQIREEKNKMAKLLESWVTADFTKHEIMPSPMDYLGCQRTNDPNFLFERKIAALIYKSTGIKNFMTWVNGPSQDLQSGLSYLTETFETAGSDQLENLTDYDAILYLGLIPEDSLATAALVFPILIEDLEDGPDIDCDGILDSEVYSKDTVNNTSNSTNNTITGTTNFDPTKNSCTGNEIFCDNFNDDNLGSEWSLEHTNDAAELTGGYLTLSGGIYTTRPISLIDSSSSSSPSSIPDSLTLETVFKPIDNNTFYIKLYSSTSDSELFLSIDYQNNLIDLSYPASGQECSKTQSFEIKEEYLSATNNSTNFWQQLNLSFDHTAGDSMALSFDLQGEVFANDSVKFYLSACEPLDPNNTLLIRSDKVQVDYTLMEEQ